MILVVDLCFRKDSLSAEEFVGPIVRIAEGTAREISVRHFSEIDKDVLERSDHVILCGTALKDTRFADEAGAFRWLEDFPRPVLGICAGMQVIAVVYGGTIVREKGIGMEEVTVTGDDPLFADAARFEAYQLHRFAAVPTASFITLAVSGSSIQAFRHPTLPTYGVMFHPEVRNDWVVERFLGIGAVTTPSSF